MNKQTILTARKLGYLKVRISNTVERDEWLRIAGEEGFPFVMVVTRKWKEPTGFMGNRDVAREVAWETAHLWPAVSEQAREYAAALAAKFPGVELKAGSNTAGLVSGILPVEEAEELAKRIIGLTGHQGVRAR